MNTIKKPLGAIGIRRLLFCIVPVLAGLILVGSTASLAQDKMSKKSVLLEAKDLKWEPIPNTNGVMTAVVWGDQNKGAHGAFTKFPAGFSEPLHYHTYATKIVVLKGAYTYNGKEYGPGSYLDIPGGDKHISGGTANSETIFFIEQPGKFDLIPVEQKMDKKQ